jgi:hypothetical protein
MAYSPPAEPALSHTMLGIVQAWLPVLTVVVGALWALYTYLDHQKQLERERALQVQKDAITRRIEVQKPFLQKQLELYFETAQIVGKLVTTKPASADWDNLERRYWALYWSELSMVEDKIVEEAMVKFGATLQDYKSRPDNTDGIRALNGAAYELAHAIRTAIESAWSGNPQQGQRAPNETGSR